MQTVRLSMASDVTADGSTGPYRPVDQRWPAAAGPDAAPALDMTFDAGALPALRAEVRSRVLRAGFPEGPAEDVVLAVHELAANAICHGDGAGGCGYGTWECHWSVRLTMVTCEQRPDREAARPGRGVPQAGWTRCLAGQVTVCGWCSR